MSSLSEQSLQEHLHAGRTALQHLRRRIKCMWLGLVLVAGVGFDWLLIFWIQYRWDQRAWFSLPYFMDGWIGELLVNFSINTVVTLRLIALALVPAFGELSFTRIIIAVEWLLVLVMEATTLVGGHTAMISREASRIMDASCVLMLLAGSALSVWAMCAVSYDKAQKRMWWGWGIFAVAWMIRPVAWTLDIAVREHRVSGSAGFIPPQFLLLFVVCRPERRKRAQGQLLQWVEGQAASRGAASLACLLGNVSPDAALAAARERFRSVLPSQITLEFLAKKTAKSVHGTWAQPCALGACDAFISHSWSDDVHSKHDALHAWSGAFVHRSGREPRIWFDKCCVDQTDIDNDLQGLPIFVKGCDRLVVLCGPSYLSRLWCITEVFTHVHMGGTIEDIELVPLLRAGSEAKDARAIEKAFENFDARQCGCYHRADKRRILNVMEVAFGSIDAFNGMVQIIITRIREQLHELASGRTTDRTLSADQVLSCLPSEVSDEERQVPGPGRIMSTGSNLLRAYSRCLSPGGDCCRPDADADYDS